MTYRYRKNHMEIATTTGDPVDLPYGLRGGIDFRDGEYWVTELTTGMRLGIPDADPDRAWEKAKARLLEQGEVATRAALKNWALPPEVTV